MAKANFINFKILTGEFVMRIFKNRYLGSLSRVTSNGVFCADEAGAERQVFTWDLPQDGIVRVPILSKIVMTPERIECFWGKDGTPPSMEFELE